MSGRDLLVRDLAAGHGGPLVLDGLDLDVPAGTTMAVLGESGAGKSTLLRVVAGLLPARRGAVAIGGVDVTTLAPERRSVGMVFQSLALFPHVDVLDNVAFGPRSAGADRTQARRVAGDWLDRVGLATQANRDIATLSGGQRQRVALARALAADPDVLLLDEPLGALDTGLRTSLLAELREVFEAADTTVLHVTHDPAEAASLAHRVAVLDHGRMVQVGTPTTLWSEPATAVVARLVGHPNVLPGDRPGRTRVVPPTAVHLDGPVADGTVVAASPGANWQVTVLRDDGTRLVAAVPARDAPEVGDRVATRLDEDAILDVAGDA